jgi:hypothetical protein
LVPLTRWMPGRTVGLGCTSAGYLCACVCVSARAHVCAGVRVCARVRACVRVRACSRARDMRARACVRACMFARARAIRAHACACARARGFRASCWTRGCDCGRASTSASAPSPARRCRRLVRHARTAHCDPTANPDRQRPAAAGGRCDAKTDRFLRVSDTISRAMLRRAAHSMSFTKVVKRRE